VPSLPLARRQTKFFCLAPPPHPTPSFFLHPLFSSHFFFFRRLSLTVVSLSVLTRGIIWTFRSWEIAARFCVFDCSPSPVWSSVLNMSKHYEFFFPPAAAPTKLITDRLISPCSLSPSKTSYLGRFFAYFRLFLSVIVSHDAGIFNSSFRVLCLFFSPPPPIPTNAIQLLFICWFLWSFS